MDDSDRGVHQQLAASLGALPSGPRETAAVALLERYADNPIVMDATLSGLRGSEGAVLERLMQGKSAQAPQRNAAIASFPPSRVLRRSDALRRDLAKGRRASRSAVRPREALE